MHSRFQLSLQFGLTSLFFYIYRFLDKIYVMSSPDAMEKFLKNPRPFLISPQPRPPCKLCVVGPPLSGKTSNCHLLAQKFNARVRKFGFGHKVNMYQKVLI